MFLVPQLKDFFRFKILATILSATFNITVGISMAFSAILIPQVEDANSDLRLTLAETSWVASIGVLAGLGGSLTAGMVMESVGRLNTIKLSAIPIAIGWVLIASASNVWCLLAGRILIGVGVSLGASGQTVFVTEIARPDLRGSLTSFGPTLASLGW